MTDDILSALASIGLHLQGHANQCHIYLSLFNGGNQHD